VNAFAHFEQTVNQVVFRQRRTSTNNMLCGEAECYANCYIDYKTNIPLSLSSDARVSSASTDSGATIAAVPFGSN